MPARNAAAAETLSLWALRYSAAKGRHWERVRSVTAETSQEWLRIFSSDEPGVQFCVSPIAPRRQNSAQA